MMDRILHRKASLGAPISLVGHGKTILWRVVRYIRSLRHHGVPVETGKHQYESGER